MFFRSEGLLIACSVIRNFVGSADLLFSAADRISLLCNRFLYFVRSPAFFWVSVLVLVSGSVPVGDRDSRDFVAMSGAAVVLADPDRIRADLRLVLRDFESELQQVQLSSAGAVTSSGGGDGGVGAPGVSPYSETEWLAHLELKFVLRAYRMELLRSLGKVLCGTVSESGIAASQSSAS